MTLSEAEVVSRARGRMIITALFLLLPYISILLMIDVKKGFKMWLLVATQEKKMMGAQGLICLVLELKVLS